MKYGRTYCTVVRSASATKPAASREKLSETLRLKEGLLSCCGRGAEVSICARLPVMVAMFEVWCVALRNGLTLAFNGMYIAIRRRSAISESTKARKRCAKVMKCANTSCATVRACSGVGASMTASCQDD